MLFFVTLKKNLILGIRYTMPTIDTLKIIVLWALHLLAWLLFNIVLGSLPIGMTLLQKGENDPLIIGLLCFCFTAASSGFYIIWVNLQKEEHGFWLKKAHTFLQVVTVVWIICVLITLFLLPQILTFIENYFEVKSCLTILYVSSVLLYLGSNIKSLSGLVNRDFSKQKIANTVSQSKANGIAMSAYLDDEGDF